MDAWNRIPKRWIFLRNLWRPLLRSRLFATVWPIPFSPLLQMRKACTGILILPSMAIIRHCWIRRSRFRILVHLSLLTLPLPHSPVRIPRRWLSIFTATSIPFSQPSIRNAFRVIHLILWEWEPPRPTRFIHGNWDLINPPIHKPLKTFRSISPAFIQSRIFVISTSFIRILSGGIISPQVCFCAIFWYKILDLASNFLIISSLQMLVEGLLNISV